MYWQELRKNGQFLRYLPDIWERELVMPKWFQASSFLWTPKFPIFVEWACDFQEIYGLFDNDKLLACIYLELDKDTATIHLSVTEKIEPQIFIDECSKLRNMLFHRGIKYIRGWTLKRNFALVKLMKEIGFRELGFTMDRGQSRGRVLRWELMGLSRA